MGKGKLGISCEVCGIKTGNRDDYKLFVGIEELNDTYVCHPCDQEMMAESEDFAKEQMEYWTAERISGSNGWNSGGTR